MDEKKLAELIRGIIREEVRADSIDELKSIAESMRHGQELLIAKVDSVDKRLESLEKSVDYLAETLGRHDKDIYVLKKQSEVHDRQ